MNRNLAYTLSWEFLARLDRVVDGDTVDLVVDLGFHSARRIRFRLQAIDAPEPRGATSAAGNAATAHLRHLLHAYSLDNVGNVPQVLVVSEKTGPYGRYQAELYGATANGGLVNLNRQMILDGHATFVEGYGGLHDQPPSRRAA